MHTSCRQPAVLASDREEAKCTFPAPESRMPCSLFSASSNEVLKSPGCMFLAEQPLEKCSYSSGVYQLFGRASLVSALPELSRDTRLTEKPEYRVWGPSGCMNCVAINDSALSDLSKAKRVQVFYVNFNCMTQWSICTDREDIMPTAGREKAKESASAD